MVKVCPNCGSLNPSEKENCRICKQPLRKEGSEIRLSAPPVEKMQKEKPSPVSEQKRTELIQLENLSNPQGKEEKITKELSGRQDVVKTLRASHFLEKEDFAKRENIKKPVNRIKEKNQSVLDGFQQNSKRPTGGASMKVNEKLKKKNEKSLFLLSGFILAGTFLIFMFLLFPPEEKEGKIFGLVMNQNKDFLPSALVTIEELNKKVTTNQAGFFLFEKIPQGIYTLKASSDGYPTLSERVTVKNKTTTTLPLLLVSNEQTSFVEADSSPLEDQKKEVMLEKQEFGGIKIESNVPEVLVFFDSELLGSGNKIYKNLPTGKHTLRLRKEGYQDWANRITIKKDIITAYKIELSPNESIVPAQSFNHFLEQGKKELKEKNFAGAVENLNQAANLSPLSPSPYLYRGKALVELGEKTRALADFFKAANLFQQEGDFDNAIECYNYLIEEAFFDPSIYFQRGWNFLQLQEYEKGIIDLKKTVELDPKFYSAYILLGDAYYQKGDYKEAVKNYLWARDINPHNRDVYAGLTKAFFALKDKNQTKKSYEKFFEFSSFVERETKKQDPQWREMLNYLGIKSQPEF